MKIREYKIRNLTLLGRFQEELPKKYGDEAKEAVNKLITKTYALRLYNLVDYLMTILRLSDKYPELRALLPSSSDIDEMLEEGNKQKYGKDKESRLP